MHPAIHGIAAVDALMNVGAGGGYSEADEPVAHRPQRQPHPARDQCRDNHSRGSVRAVPALPGTSGTRASHTRMVAIVAGLTVRSGCGPRVREGRRGSAAVTTRLRPPISVVRWRRTRALSVRHGVTDTRTEILSLCPNAAITTITSRSFQAASPGVHRGAISAE